MKLIGRRKGKQHGCGDDVVRQGDGIQSSVKWRIGGNRGGGGCLGMGRTRPGTRVNLSEREGEFDPSLDRLQWGVRMWVVGRWEGEARSRDGGILVTGMVRSRSRRGESARSRAGNAGDRKGIPWSTCRENAETGKRRGSRGRLGARWSKSCWERTGK